MHSELLISKTNDNQTYSPVVVQMSEGVSQTLVNIGRRLRVVVDDVERRGRHSALVDALRHQEEVETVALGDRVVDDRAGQRVLHRIAHFVEQSRVDPFADDDVGQRRHRKSYKSSCASNC